uniref:Protein kinase domain-containing protein n=1 Tax=Caenorhabditis japonica TaxID=281687 RepID=A0A8R1E0L9_CAEJA
MCKQRKGHDFEKVYLHFTPRDARNFKPKQVFDNKWIIMKNSGKRGDAHCYDVSDKKGKEFGKLYVEVSEEGVGNIVNQIEFAHKQFSLGNSHRFPSILDVGIINNHIYYMVLLNRPGPTMSALFEMSMNFSPITVAFIAFDLISVAELLTSSGYVLRYFDPKQWKFDVKSRTFFLADLTDVIVISDKRYRLFSESLFGSGDNGDLQWNNFNDVTYAPIAFHSDGINHRMSEFDMLESLLYVIYKLARGNLPWQHLTNEQKIMEMKVTFMNCPPEMDRIESDEELWLDTAFRNITEYMKLARKTQEKLEKLPVRDGAWCPNGARAGALLSTIKYCEILDDFHRVVISGRPVWSVYWRDVKLDWDREISQTQKALDLLRKVEKREISWEVIRETARLAGIREHYTIMQEHDDAETRLNSTLIQKYLQGTHDEQGDVKVASEEVNNVKKRKRRTKKQIEEDKRRQQNLKLEDVNDEVKVEIEEEEEKEEEKGKF